jgi:hypothetical protein
LERGAVLGLVGATLVIVDVGATVRVSAVGGATVGIGAGAVVGASVGERLSHCGEGVMMGTVDGAGTSDGESAGGSLGTWSGRCVCCWKISASWRSC